MSDFLERDSKYQEQSTTASDGYTRIYWMNGEPRDGTPGRFWANPDQLVEAGISFEKPWKVVNHTFSDGNKKDIAVATALHIAPICWRQQTYTRDATGQITGWVTERTRGKMQPGQSVFFEMLCLVEGLNSPVVLSAKAIKTSMAWLADILPAYRKMRDEIKKSRNGRSVPPWWFWLAIRSELGPDKKPVYDKTPQGKAITPPRWIVPGDITQRDTWAAMYVGNEWADIGEEWYDNGGADWATCLISDTYAGATPEATEAGRNVPVAIDDTNNDIPF